MSDENTNVQPAANTEPAPATGPTVEEQLAQMKAEFERTREGLVRDLQQERAKRHELEQKVYSQPAPSAAKPDVAEDELGKVLDPYNRPIRQMAEDAARRATALEARLNEERAKAVLSARSGRKWEDIEADKALQDKLVDVTRRYNISGTPDVVVQRAYDIMELEDLKTKEAERARSAAASKAASIPSGSAPAPVVSGKEFSADDFSNLSPKEFDVMSRSGTFRKVGDKFVYKSHK